MMLLLGGAITFTVLALFLGDALLAFVSEQLERRRGFRLEFGTRADPPGRASAPPRRHHLAAAPTRRRPAHRSGSAMTRSDEHPLGR
jgi:hypothetical protein